MRKNFDFFKNGIIYQNITGNNYSYLQFYNSIYESGNIEIESAIEIVSGILDQSTDVDKDIEILINLMVMLNSDLEQVMNHQKDWDSLKTFNDYINDASDIIIGTYAVEMPDSLSGKFSELVKDGTDVIFSNKERFDLANKALNNYNSDSLFLKSIINNTYDEDLKKAAEILLNAYQEIYTYQLYGLSENAKDTSFFIGKDVALDGIVLYLIDHPEKLKLDSTTQWCLKQLGDAYQKFDTGISSINTGAKIGVFAGDMLIGASNMFNRLNEIKILGRINDALIKTTNKLKIYPENINDIYDACECLRFILYINARGDYCISKLLEDDSQFCSLAYRYISKKVPGEWYESLKEMYIDSSEHINNVIPDMQYYIINSSSNGKNNRSDFAIMNDGIIYYCTNESIWDGELTPEFALTEDLSNERGLYSLDTRTNQKELLVPDLVVSSMDVVDNAIFLCVSSFNYNNEYEYNKLYKFNLETREVDMISDKEIYYSSLFDEWIYYSSRDGIRKMCLDGSKDEEFIQGEVVLIGIVDNYLSYWKDGQKHIYNLFTNEEIEVEVGYDNVIYLADRFYRAYRDDFKITSFDQLMQNEEILFDKGKKPRTSDAYLNADDQFLYYSIWTYEPGELRGIYKMKLDGTDLQKISDDNVSDFSILGDWIYYHVYGAECMVTYDYKMKVDGSERQHLDGRPGLIIDTSKSSTSILELMPTTFVLTSGLGGSSTTITINTDGSFIGQFQDYNLGEDGNDYSKGTVYISNFEGQFTKPVKIDDNIYSMNLEAFKINDKKNDTYYENGFRYICVEPEGFENANEFLIYVPGINISDLPSGFISWLSAFVDIRKVKSLPYYGIYNVNEETGFVEMN